jgi:hypothetical protein
MTGITVSIMTITINSRSTVFVDLLLEERNNPMEIILNATNMDRMNTGKIHSEMNSNVICEYITNEISIRVADNVYVST